MRGSRKRSHRFQKSQGFLRGLGYVYLLLATCISIFAGCTVAKQDQAEVEKVDFTVLKESEIPEELKSKIEEKKEEPFQIAYTDAGYTYVAIGYGSQPTGGYSIMVEQCYVSETNLCVKTKFIGPEQNRQLVQTITYPCIVIKMSDMGKELLFLGE